MSWLTDNKVYTSVGFIKSINITKIKKPQEKCEQYRIEIKLDDDRTYISFSDTLILHKISQQYKIEYLIYQKITTSPSFIFGDDVYHEYKYFVKNIVPIIP